MRRITICLMICLMGLNCLAFSAWAASSKLLSAVPAGKVTEAGAFLEVEAEGMGTSRDEALMDARRNAVQQAVGVLSRGVTETTDDRVRENVIQLSRAYIEKYEILDERRDGARWTVKIQAWIRGENLLNGLRQKSPDSSPFDGAGLFTGAMSRARQIEEAGEMLIEVFSSMPYSSYVHTAAGAEDMNAGTGEITLDVRFSFDRERYFSQAVPLFASALDYVSEAKLKDVPFTLELQGGDPVIVEPPSGIDSLSRYMELMEVKNENRYIDLPGAGEFANIYLMKKNYYFDCYRVPAEAFALLTENLLLTGGQNRLTGRAFGGADLKIAFKTKAGQLVKEHVEPMQLQNVMVFASLSGLKRSPYTKGKPDQLNGQRHALFILPCIGIIEKDDYVLIENETASISAKLTPKEIQQVSQAECSISMKAISR